MNKEDHSILIEISFYFCIFLLLFFFLSCTGGQQSRCNGREEYNFHVFNNVLVTFLSDQLFNDSLQSLQPQNGGFMACKAHLAIVKHYARASQSHDHIWSAW